MKSVKKLRKEFLEKAEKHRYRTACAKVACDMACDSPGSAEKMRKMIAMIDEERPIYEIILYARGE